MKKLAYIITLIFTLTTAAILPANTAHAATQTPMTRSEADQRALKIINLQWTYSSNLNNNIDPKYASSVTAPSQFTGVTTSQAIGIPYAWGGFDGLDTSSYNEPWTNFLEAINTGAFAGNVNSKGGYGYVPGTAGLDCSGFVQAVFNIHDYKLSTSTIFSNYFTKIDMSELKHMDILDAPGNHVVIFDKWGYENGNYGAFTYESTPDQFYGGIQGTKHYFLSMNSINKAGYIPGRYMYITDDTADATTTVTTPSPIAVTTQASIVVTTPVAATTPASVTTTTSAPAVVVPAPAVTTPAPVVVTTPASVTTTTPAPAAVIAPTSATTTPAPVVVTTPAAATVVKTPQITKGMFAQVVNTATYANLRANPATTASVLTTIPKGTIIYLSDYSSGWYKVSYKGVIGWIYGNLVGTIPSGKYVTLIPPTTSLNIRSNPSTTSTIIGTLTPNQYAEVIGYSADGNWYQIRINGIIGWSSKKYLSYIY